MSLGEFEEALNFASRPIGSDLEMDTLVAQAPDLAD